MSTFVLMGWWLLAEGEGAANGAPAGGGQGMLQMMFPIIMIGIVFWLLLIRPEKRRMAEHQSLLEALKKNDRVVTSGGIYGVVANVQRDADRVTLKVDEATNTKIDVTFASISRVLSDDAAEKSTDK